MATTVLGLKTFTASDPVDYNEINDNYSKIDNGVKTAFQGRAAHNLLDNSDFRNPVNQRGQSSYKGDINKNKYTIDRWFFTYNDGELTIGDGYIQKTNHKFWQWLQGIDTAKMYTGAICLADGTMYVYSGTFNDGFGSWNNTIWCGITSGVPNFRIEIGMTSPIIWAALYEGSYDASTLPAYQPKGYAAELAECQRYYYAVENELFFSAFADIHGCLDYTVLLPQTMRAIPTVTFEKLQYIDESGYVSFTNSPYYTGRDRVAIRKLGLTPNKAYGLSMKFSASADL